MAASVVSFILLLAMAGSSDAAYCVCNSGGDSVFQKNIDYACGAGADCSAIRQNGACYNPNTVKDHCSYAVNSYYQRKGQVPGSCDFSGTAAVSQTAPSAASGCVYPSSSSGTPSTSTPTPTTTNSSSGGNPSASGGTTTGIIPGSSATPGFSIAPSGPGFNTDGSGNGASSTQASVSPIALVLLSSALFTYGLRH